MTAPSLLDELEDVVRQFAFDTPQCYARDAAYNFLRTHHAEIADMAKRLEAAERDAARYRWLRDVWGGWMAVGSKMRVDVRTPLWSGDWDSFDEAIDDIADFDATQEGKG
jgi:hypothetical protein